MATYISEHLSADFFNLSGKTWQEKLNTLNTCTCCYRHQYNKPNTMVLWTHLHKNYYYVNKLCKCSCRHLARFICRQFDDKGIELLCPICE